MPNMGRVLHPLQPTVYIPTPSHTSVYSPLSSGTKLQANLLNYVSIATYAKSSSPYTTSSN